MRAFTFAAALTAVGAVASARPLKDDLRKRSAADLRDERDQLGGWVRQPEVRWLDPAFDAAGNRLG